jgi:hypothetical protein
VRESKDVTAPENSIEIVTPSRVYLIVAEDEDEMIRWLNALGLKCIQLDYFDSQDLGYDIRSYYVTTS